jgi:transaldolase
MNRLREIGALGQSVWLDNLTRRMIRDGRLEQLIREDGLSGITSNPAIFQKAMTAGDAYDDSMRALAAKGLGAPEIYERLAVTDIQDAADLLRPTFDRTNGTDGFVSLEVSPHLARDPKGTVAEARRLWRNVGRPNVFIKIPGTDEGVPAIEQCLAEGIPINITLLFSLSAYRKVMEAHLRALEMRRSTLEPPSIPASVASFFLSRIDTKMDGWIDALARDPARAAPAGALRGRAAVASARLAYQEWKRMYSGPRWEALAEAGARFQKPLWASTSTKDPSYPDLKYVEPLIGPHTVNTMPDETLDAFRDHGRAGVTVEENLIEEATVEERLSRLGLSLERATRELVEEGIVKFVQPFDALLAALEEKRKALLPSRA